MSPRRAWLPYAVLVASIGLALTVPALRRAPIRVYALGVPNQTQVVGVNPGTPAVCEGPVTVPAPAGAIRVWAGGATGPARALITVLRAGGPGSAVLAAGEMMVGSLLNPYTAQLDRPLRTRGPVRVCVAAASGPFGLYGGAPARASVVIHAGSHRLRAEFSLVFFGAARPSFFGSLGTVADRASLFRFGWVGPWTIWLLAMALLGAVVAGGVAISRAAAEDGERGGDRSEQGA